jgi:hypothetical protein
MPGTEDLRVTIMDIPEANLVRERLQEFSCVQRVVRIPPDLENEKPRAKFQGIWEWMVKYKKPTFIGASDKSTDMVTIFLKMINGRPQIHVRTGKGKFTRFELMDYESEQERMTAQERNIVRR